MYLLIEYAENGKVKHGIEGTAISLSKISGYSRGRVQSTNFRTQRHNQKNVVSVELI